jgi:hypothetical protein
MLQERLNIQPSGTKDNNKGDGDKMWLHAMLHRGRTERITTIVMITPELAKAMLELNKGNRPIGENRVKRHMERLKSGTFILTHQGIAFADDGTLNDGQHRLTAIAQSGVGAEMQVTFGASRDEFLVVDKGDRRTSGDDLNIMRMSYGNIRASVSHRLYSIEHGIVGSIDPEIVTQHAQQNANEQMELALTTAYRLKKITQPTASALAHYWIATRTKQSKARQDDFWGGLITGENISGVLLKLREWLKDEKPEQHNYAHQNVVIAAVIILGWNSFNRRGIKALQHKSWPHIIKLPEPV